MVKLGRVVDALGALGRLQRRIRFQVEVQILDLVHLPAHNLITLQIVVDLDTEKK